MKGYIGGPVNTHLRYKGCRAGRIPVEYAVYEPNRGKFTPEGNPSKAT